MRAEDQVPGLRQQVDERPQAHPLQGDPQPVPVVRPDPAPLVSGAHVVVGASYAVLEAIMQGAAVVGAGFWGFGAVTADNLFDAMKTNFGVRM